MFEKEAVVLLAYLDGCNQTGKLVLRDGTGTMPVIIENKDGVDSEFWFQLLADVTLMTFVIYENAFQKLFCWRDKKNSQIESILDY